MMYIGEVVIIGRMPVDCIFLRAMFMHSWLSYLFFHAIRSYSSRALFDSS